MSGRLIYLMGPSGAGKDTILQGVSHMMGNRALLAQRIVTRTPGFADDGALAVTEPEFLQMEQVGLLAMSWRAHGLAYGILRHIDARLAAGQDVLINGSRGYLPIALERYRTLMPVLVCVKPSLLQERLRRRGRETEAQIQARLVRNAAMDEIPERCLARLVRIDNSERSSDAVQALYVQLQQRPVDALREKGL
ncbi:phosphonate metabolism protein/1,5-bisphosphokinase (PRPP-forming) PhnN [Alcaligenaceae bacterium]|nr:phosphonate metabolism protein/1,5-bisphosphokinase (PRPP-forming) PhnN [Alcaligenaceae bacterium]